LGRREFFLLPVDPNLRFDVTPGRRPRSVSSLHRDRRDWRLCAALVVLSGLSVVFLVSACSSPAPDTRGLRPITDEIGREIQVKPQPQRIVSLAPSITEVLFALGLADRIVGVTSFCDYPPEAVAKEKVGDTLRPSIERIVALKADLVIASTASQLQQFVYNLGEVNIPVYVSDPRDVDGVLESIMSIGELTGTTARAQELTGELRARVERVRTQLGGKERPRVLCILGGAPLITIGARSFITDLINQAGGRSISEDLAGDYPQYSLESAVAKRPEVIFNQTGEAGLPERLKETPAGRSGRVFHLDDNLLFRPGPRLVDGLEQMAPKLHPEVFGSE
jgi:cobalamin transport system substrate-binding protein